MPCINKLTFIHPEHQFYNWVSQSINFTGEVNVPCGRCLGCRIIKMSQDYFLANRELLTLYKKGESASFITLTYNDENLPHNKQGYQTLRKDDVTKFYKRLRMALQRAGITKKIKYIYCGEYGDGSHAQSDSPFENPSTTHRPHYHLCLFGLTESQIKPFVNKCWQKGIVDFGPLTQGGLRYILSYVTQFIDKTTQTFYELCDVEFPFLHKSIGIGKEWILENMNRIVDNDFTFSLNGKLNLYPAYVINFICNHLGIDKHKRIRNFMLKDKRQYPDVSNEEYLYIKEENEYIKLHQKILAQRSKGLPIDNTIFEKSYLRPFHTRMYPDSKKESENINKLVNLAIGG